MSKKKKKFGNPMKQRVYEEQKRSEKAKELTDAFVEEAKLRNEIIVKRLLREGRKHFCAYLDESLQYTMVIIDDELMLNFDSAVCNLPAEPELEKKIISEIEEMFSKGSSNPRMKFMDYSLSEGLTFRYPSILGC